jgi:hypothetical protein
LAGRFFGEVNMSKVFDAFFFKKIIEKEFDDPIRKKLLETGFIYDLADAANAHISELKCEDCKYINTSVLKNGSVVWICDHDIDHAMFGRTTFLDFGCKYWEGKE